MRQRTDHYGSFHDHLNTVFMEPNTGCWLWPGNANANLYGLTKISGHQRLAHREVYSYLVGPIPDGMVVMHSCDVPLCVNPVHLRLGTQLDNIADMKAKGRRKGKGIGKAPHRGVEYKSAKLTDDKVRLIRKDSRVKRVVALEHGISGSLVSMIQSRKRWRHVDD